MRLGWRGWFEWLERLEGCLLVQPPVADVCGVMHIHGFPARDRILGVVSPLVMRGGKDWWGLSAQHLPVLTVAELLCTLLRCPEMRTASERAAWSAHAQRCAAQAHKGVGGF
jgi:hypothetical protein